MSTLIDTHCHLNLGDAFPDPAAAIEEARAAGVAGLIVIGIDVESSRRAVEIAEEHEGVFSVVGIHPNSATTYSSAALKDIEDLFRSSKVVALGEIGLDFFWDFAAPEQQAAALREQLDLAEALGKPVVFHCREAYNDLLIELERRKPGDWLLHCFSGTAKDADRAVKLGCYFGIDGPITYPKANELREIARSLPRDRIVVETDSPYLTPAPHRGKPNKPAYVTLVNSGLASCLGLEPDDCARMTTDNALRFFRVAQIEK